MRGVRVGVVVLVVLAFSAVASLAAEYVISNFETDGDLAQWEATGCIDPCNPGNPDSGAPSPATLSRASTYATSGVYGCKMDLPAVSYPGMTLALFASHDWSAYDVVKMDIYNPNSFAVTFNLEISDSQPGYENRTYFGKALIPGPNVVEVDLWNLARNDSGYVDPADIQRFDFWISGFSSPITMYIDYIRLETVQDDPQFDAARNIWKFDFGPTSSPRWRDFFGVSASDVYPVDASTKPFGFTDDQPRYNEDQGGPDNLTRDYVRGIPCSNRCFPNGSDFDFRVRVPNGTYEVYVIARSGNSSNMPVRGWQIWAEDELKVNVPMDATRFYSTDFYYRGLEDDYPFSSPAWEQYEAANYPAYTFPTAVADGALDLRFTSAWVYALIVYPTAVTSEMEGRITALEKDRQKQFESSYYINPPQDLTFEPMPEETARGYAAWPVATMDPCYPDTLPPSPPPALALSASASLGEYRPVTFAIRPLGNLTDLTVEAGDLTDGLGHTIDASEIEVQYVRYLATPDSEFFGSGVLTWKPRLLQKSFPIPVPAQVTKQFWLTLHVPMSAAPGTYTGIVILKTSARQLPIPLTLEVWPIQLDPANDMAFGWYYMSPDERYCFSDFPALAGAGDAMLRADFVDMRRHGYNALQFPGPRVTLDGLGHLVKMDTSEMDRYLTAMREVGFGGDWVGQVGTLNTANQLMDEVSEFSATFNTTYKQALAGIVGWSDTNDAPLAMYLVDEPRESMIASWNRNFADTMSYCLLAQQVPGAVTTVTVMADEEEGVDYTPFADALDTMQTHPWPLSAGLIAGAVADDKPNWFYNTGGDLRFVYGFYQLKYAGYGTSGHKRGGGAWEWHYDWLDGGIFDPFPYSPFNNHWRYTYPSPAGPVPTLRYEWGSQGIWDHRYAATLERLSREARETNLSQMVAWADDADALLAEIKSDTPTYAVDAAYRSQHFAGIAEGPGCLTQVEQALDGYRARIADTLMRMPASLEGAEYDVSGVLSQSLAWGQKGACTVGLVNTGTTTWHAMQGYQLTPATENDRWQIEAAPLLGDVAPGGGIAVDFDIVGPPWTTLSYPQNATPTDPGRTDGASSDWILSLLATPIPGERIADEITVSRFQDVQKSTNSEWSRFYVEECAGRAPAIVSGFGASDYRPLLTVGRDAMAVYVARATDYDLATPTGPIFPDVPAKHWAAPEIKACVDHGVVQGYPDGKYWPGNIVTRDQMAVFMANALKFGLPTVTKPPFLDVPKDHWAAKYIKACADHHIVQGYEDGNYVPGREVTREQIAVFVYRGFIQPSGAPVALAGPAVKELADTLDGPWMSITEGSAAGPGFAYVTLDAMRLDASLTPSGQTFDVRFELRPAAEPETPVSFPYAHTVHLTAGTIHLARDHAASSGYPYYTVQWEIADGLDPGDYLLVVSAANQQGAMHEFGLRSPFTILPAGGGGAY